MKILAFLVIAGFIAFLMALFKTGSDEDDKFGAW